MPKQDWSLPVLWLAHDRKVNKEVTINSQKKGII